MLYNGNTKIIKIGNDNAAYDTTKKVYQYYKPAEQGTDWSQEYLTFLALEDGTFKNGYSAMDYSLDGGQTWASLAANTPTPTVTAGSKIMFRGEQSAINVFSSTGQFEAMGNPLSMVYNDNFSTVTDISSVNRCLQCLFSGSTGITNAENLSLRASTLGMYSYDSMFSGCTSLAKAPELPATTLANSCYHNMFKGCTSLATAPELTVTTLDYGCYAAMFDGCTSLTTAPELPATTLVSHCYNSMFNGCTSLTTAPELPATTLSDSCYNAMFAGCISLATAPELSATTLAGNCYGNMFNGCTSLNYVKMLATDTSAQNCLTNWLYNVASSGTFVKSASMTTLPTGTSGIPSGWAVIDN